MNEGYKDCVGLLELYGELEPLSEHWYKMGLQVKIGKSKLATFERLNGHSTEKSLYAVCRAWLSIERKLTWERVVMVLQGVGLGGKMKEVADDINKRFCQQSGSESTPNKSIGSNTFYSMVCQTKPIIYNCS